MIGVINDFRGENDFLSSSYPCILIMDNEAYPTLEHAFQASKTNDLTARLNIRNATTAREAKKLGRTVTLIQDWDQKRLDVMASLIKQKFTEHVDLKFRLLLTGNKDLIQGNTRKDTFWGQDQNGVGENHLGKILMNLRTQLRTTEGDAFQTLVKYLQDRKFNDMAAKLEVLVKFAETCVAAAYDLPTNLRQDVDGVKDVLTSLK